jgi:uncharacterized membrane protein
MFKKLFLKINPVEVIKALKKTDTKVKVEGITQMGGGGVLITSGITLVIDGATAKSWDEIVAGCILLIVGFLVAKNLTDKIEKIKDNEESC